MCSGQADDKSLNVVALLPSLIPGGAVSSRASNEGLRRFHNHGDFHVYLPCLGTHLVSYGLKCESTGR